MVKAVKRRSVSSVSVRSDGSLQKEFLLVLLKEGRSSEVPTQRDRPSQSERHSVVCSVRETPHTVGELPPHCEGKPPQCGANSPTLWGDPPTLWARTPTVWAVLPHSVGVFPHNVGESPPHCEGFPPHYTSQCDVQCDTLTWSVTLGWYLRPSYGTHHVLYMCHV